MANSIIGSVSEGRQNSAEDVRTIYALFNKILPSPLAMSEQCSTEFIQAIRDFQKAFMSRPDGRIDVGGRTWGKLTEATTVLDSDINFGGAGADIMDRLFKLSFAPYHCPELRWGDTEATSCSDGSNKKDWYEREQRLLMLLTRIIGSTPLGLGAAEHAGCSCRQSSAKVEAAVRLTDILFSLLKNTELIIMFRPSVEQVVEVMKS